MSDINIRVEGFSRIIYNNRELRKAIKAGGILVQREARRLVSSSAVSSAGDFPGKNSGALRRSIRMKVGSGGGYVTVAPRMTEEIRRNTTGPNDGKADFYPMFLHRGTSRGIQPRKDYMQTALDNKSYAIRGAIHRALQNALTTA